MPRTKALKRTVQLRVGVEEDEAAVGEITFLLRQLSLERPTEFKELYACAADDATPSQAAIILAGNYNFVDDDGLLYDDVKDVLLSLVERHGNTLQLRSSPLADN